MLRNWWIYPLLSKPARHWIKRIYTKQGIYVKCFLSGNKFLMKRLFLRIPVNQAIIFIPMESRLLCDGSGNVDSENAYQIEYPTPLYPLWPPMHFAPRSLSFFLSSCTVDNRTSRIETERVTKSRLRSHFLNLRNPPPQLHPRNPFQQPRPQRLWIPAPPPHGLRFRRWSLRRERIRRRQRR